MQKPRMSKYERFLAGKTAEAKPSGFEVSRENLNANLFPWQADIVLWSLSLGRAAMFEECGLGKTLQQLAWAEQVAIKTGKPVLILTPLSVASQTVAEAKRFGIGVPVAFADGSGQVPAREPAIWVTNYQKLDKFDCKRFGGVVLDESSILKSFTGSTKQKLCHNFARTPYKLCCTATPAPNDYMELGNHAEFLGVMPSNEMLSRWFIADQGEGAGAYRLKGHAEADFWHWVTSWACCLSKPSDLGYSDDGFVLPELRIIEHVVPVDLTEDTGGKLIRDDKLSSTSMHKEMRRTCAARARAVGDLVNSDSDQWAVWCNTDYEADALQEVVSYAVEVRGKHSDAIKEHRLTDFPAGKFRVLISKPSICGFGMNWQHCHKMAFIGLSWSFEQFYQAVRRCWRFGQTLPVEAHVFFAETEGEVLAAIKRKQADATAMREKMVAAMRVHWHGKSDERQRGAYRPVMPMQVPAWCRRKELVA